MNSLEKALKYGEGKCTCF